LLISAGLSAANLAVAPLQLHSTKLSRAKILAALGLFDEDVVRKASSITANFPAGQHSRTQRAAKAKKM